MSLHRKHEGRVTTPSERKLITKSKAISVMDSNSFENFKQKRHMNVLGVKTQVVHKSKGHSKDLQKRKETLLVEFKKKDRRNNFIDNREKHLEKTIRKVTKKSLKRNRFNLEEDDNDVGANKDVLSANLGDLDVHDDFNLEDDYYKDLEEEEYEQSKKKRRLDKSSRHNDIVEEFENSKLGGKKHREMQQNNSKVLRAAKRTQKEAILELTEELDESHDHILQYLSVSKNAKLPKDHPLMIKKLEEEPQEEDNNNNHVKKIQRNVSDNYYEAMKVMSYEERVKPSFDKLKTCNQPTVDPVLEQSRKARMAPKAARDTHLSADALDDHDLQYLSDQEDEQPAPQPKAIVSDRIEPCPSAYEQFLTYISTSMTLDSALQQLQASKRSIKFLLQLFQERTSMQDLDVIQSHLFDMAEIVPKDACDEFVKVIKRMNSSVHGRKEIMFLKCCGNVFPASDFRHSIMSAVNLMIGQWIAEIETNMVNGLIDGLLLCAIAYQFNYEARRVVPEVITYLNKILQLLSPDQYLHADVKANHVYSPLPFDDRNLHLTTDLKLDIRHAVFELLKKFIALYSDAITAAELFEPTGDLLQQIGGHDSVQIIERINALNKRRERLSWLQVKPVAIPVFTPRSNSDAYRGSIVDSDSVRLQTKILQRKTKREMRGAIREVRKDNMFLRKAREDKEAREARERKEKYKEIVGDLQRQNREHYQMDYSNRQREREAKQNRKSRKEGMGKIQSK